MQGKAIAAQKGWGSIFGLVGTYAAWMPWIAFIARLLAAGFKYTTDQTISRPIDDAWVYASEHEEVLAQVRHAQRRADVLEALVRQLACTTPRKGEWESSYRVLQMQARRAVAALAQRAVIAQ